MEEYKFYQTYYFCNVINNVLRDPFPYVRNLNDFYGEGRVFYFLGKFEKYSIFHKFIKFVVDGVYEEHLTQSEPHESTELPIERALKYYNVPFTSFIEFFHDKNLSERISPEDACCEYMNELRHSEAYDLLLQKTTDEIFYILFQNRELLLIFNEMIADAFKRENTGDCPQELKKHLNKKTSVAKRVNIPVWVQRAIFFRDRGRCVLCNRDLSGILNLDNKENFDHIVPLGRFGFNDITNIQLLCSDCNQKKLAGRAITSKKFQPWY